MQREPAIIIGALEAAVIAVIAAIGIALDLEPALTAALVGAGAAIVALVGAIITRTKVTPVTEGEA